MRGKKTSVAVRAQVVAALLSGQGVNETAHRYNLPKQTVSRIKAAIDPADLGLAETQKKENLANLIEGHLIQNLRATTSLAKRIETDDRWFNKQSAAEIATLYGVLSDKAIRLLEAIERGQQQQPS